MSSRGGFGARCRRGAGDESGSIAIMAAVLAVALILSASLAVDVGQVAASSRDQQGATDRAALDGLRELQRATAEPPEQSQVADRAVESLDRNGFSEDALGDHWESPGVTLGRVEPGAMAFDESPGEGSYNAVMVETESFQPFLLALGDDEGGRTLRKRAIAATEEIGTISAASRTGSVTDEGLLGALLEGLLGSSIENLDVVGYEGLADARVDLLVLAGELGLGTVDELASVDVVSFDELVGATISALEAEDDVLDAEIDALEALRAAATSSELDEIELGEILSVATGSGSGADVGIDASALIMASLQMANRDNWLTLGVDALPGVTEARAHVIEAPVIATGPALLDDPSADETVVQNWVTTARTAQIELDLTLEVDELHDLPLLEEVLESVTEVVEAILCDIPLLGLLCALGDDPLDEFGTIEARVVTARGESALVGTSCQGDGVLETRTDVNTLDTDVGLELATSDFLFDTDEGELDLEDLGLGARLSISDAEGEPADFDGPFPAETKTVPGDGSPELELETDDLGGGLLEAVGDGDDVDLRDATEELLNGVLLEDDGVVTSLLDLLGVSLGSVDVRGQSLDCDGRRLLPLDVEGAQDG